MHDLHRHWTKSATSDFCSESRASSIVSKAKTFPPAFSLEEDGLALSDGLRKSGAADQCANWIREKAEIRSIKRAGLMHGKLYHVHDGKRDHALVGSSNFTLKGLGLSDEPNIELNLIVDSDRDRDDLLAWFNELWSDEELPPGGIMQPCERATGDCPPT